ncbi:MAG: peptidase M23 [Candidatus Viridilinea halotolerans]|uniref:Peptidase M23 n=1 Tax=Candidatus Viridilinea halotolerans TaxID=2491704 RepID=A0A426U845_9CHLR|nr:MAG: peptidase M23 [Candidatus Viridilinea halotolerans]
MVRLCFSCLLLTLLVGLWPVPPAAAQLPDELNVQRILDAHPGVLKQFTEDGRSAATLIESAALYYGLSPQIHLALLEATAGLLSDPAPPASRLQYPIGPSGPQGFAAQLEWASRELRAGLGPYERPPTVRFSDGMTLTLTLDQAMEGVAVQRLLAQGRTEAQWREVVERFGVAFERYFGTLLLLHPHSPPAAISQGFLLQPWPMGTRVEHLAYFDHAYPTVDSGLPGTGYATNYRGQTHVPYDGHDGNDYYFPDQPIGTPILAAAGGTAYARTHRGLGVVIVHPDGFETVYWHLDGFAPIFAGHIDSNVGVAVHAGDFIGTSGATGFVVGTPHLHFEVRRYGLQVDPYGWYGPGPDPCANYAGCLPSGWLWHPSLLGRYNFTPPGMLAGPSTMLNPPIGTLSVNPPSDLLFASEFDGHPVQRVGRGFPSFANNLRFTAGRNGQALLLDAATLTYPLAGNLDPSAGTLSLWAKLPESYPTGNIPRHYLLAASANPAAIPDYWNTLALRRDAVGPDGGPAWIFWTTGSDAASRDILAAPDALAAGWHHFALTWDAASGRKELYLNGQLAAATSAISLPTELGDTLHLGRFTHGSGHSNAELDQLLIYNRPLTATEIAALAAAPPADLTAPVVITDTTIRIDANAIASEGGIVAVQLGLNGTFEAPQPYYDAYRWSLPAHAGEHELAVRYSDRFGQTATVTQPLTLELPPLTRIYLPLVGR